MLVFSRKLNEAFIIDEDVTVTLIGLEPASVGPIRLRIEMSKHRGVWLWRDEAEERELEHDNTLEVELLRLERVIIDRVILVILIEVRGEKARFAIEVPREMPVRRPEL